MTEPCCSVALIPPQSLDESTIHNGSPLKKEMWVFSSSVSDLHINQGLLCGLKGLKPKRDLEALKSKVSLEMEGKEVFFTTHISKILHVHHVHSV